MDWVIACPAWGPRCLEAFTSATLPSIVATGHTNIRFIVHTDQPATIAKALHNFKSIILPVPPGKNPHVSFGIANREAIALAGDGECIALINADMVCSREVFSAAEKRFGEGKRQIMMAATRTIGDRPPIGSSSSELLKWTMQHRHPAIKECFWNKGRSCIPWAIYFEDGEEIVLHGFHLQPFAMVKDRPLGFKGATADFDLADNYKREEIHLVTDCNEASFAEMSPPERVFPLRQDFITKKSVVEWARRNTTHHHRWLFDQRISITGNGRDIGDGEICTEILREI